MKTVTISFGRILIKIETHKTLTNVVTVNLLPILNQAKKNKGTLTKKKIIESNVLNISGVKPPAILSIILTITWVKPEAPPETKCSATAGATNALKP